MTERVVSRLHTEEKTAGKVLASLELLILNHERKPTKDLKIFYKVELWKLFLFYYLP